MKKPLIALAAATLSPTLLSAGGLDRSGQGINILFEEGDAVQVALSYTSPSVSGSLAGTDSGNVGKSFFAPHLAYKKAINDKWDIALIYDEPYGAHVEYSSSYFLSQNPVPGAAQSVLKAEANTQALTALARYKFEGGFSAYGGIRAQRVDSDVTVPIVAGYRVSTDNPVDFGYVIGAAWEKPEIAARVALTYNSKIDHTFSQTETNSLGLNAKSESEISTPQSVNLDFQTGVAQDTLVFGTIRWVDWPQLSYSPPNYAPGELVGYSNSTISYTLGVGRRFSDEFSGAITIGYETSEDEPVSNLGPTDGYWSIGLGGTYSLENAKISGGVRYTDIGDATTDGAGPGLRGNFSGNHAWSVGFQVTYALGNS
jgi:long-subunit fatty acid transport protein